MKKLLLLLLLMNLNYAFGQKSKSYLLQWNVKDTVSYATAMGEFTLKINEVIVDLNDSSAQFVAEKLRKSMGINMDDYKLTTKVYPQQENFEVAFFLDAHLLVKGTIDKHGNLLTYVKKQGENFFKFFFRLPEKPVGVGDEWFLDMRIQKNSKGITMTDSTRTDKVVFESVSQENKKAIATIKYELSESYRGRFKDESGKEGKASMRFFYNATGYFNITDGKWKSMDGVVIFDFDVLEKKRTVLKVGLIEE